MGKHIYYIPCLFKVSYLFKLTERMAATVRTVVGNVKPRLNVFKTYFWAELAPPLSPSEVSGAFRAAGDLITSIIKGRFLLNTTSQAATNLLIGAEIAGCFFIGEVIGRRSLIGYNVGGHGGH